MESRGGWQVSHLTSHLPGLAPTPAPALLPVSQSYSQSCDFWQPSPSLPATSSLSPNPPFRKQNLEAGRSCFSCSVPEEMVTTLFSLDPARSPMTLHHTSFRCHPVRKPQTQQNHFPGPSLTSCTPGSLSHNVSTEKPWFLQY